MLPPVPNASFSPPPSAPVARPIIKLKVGPQNRHNSVPSKGRSQKPKPEVDSSSIEATHLDVPPPPYIDDGSHDLLQEVIALEEEKSRQRSVQEKVVNGSTSKRKKDDIFDDDDILALATPSKRERPSPPEPSSSSSAPQKITITAKQFQDEKPSEMSLKGKEKEIISNTELRSSKSPTPLNEKKCRDVIKSIQKLSDAAIFSRPVDPVLDACPT